MINLVFGVDISKSTLDACCVRFGENRHFHDSFLNKKLGFSHFTQWVDKFKAPTDEVLVCMEHTGHYAHGFIRFLRGKGLDVAQVNPLKIKRSLGLRREKSDKADSLAIARYGLKFQEELRVNLLTDREFLELQLLMAHRKRVQEKMLAFQRQLKYLKHCLSTDCSKKVEKELRQFKSYFAKHLRRIDKDIDQFVLEQPAIRHNHELLLSIPGIGRVISLYTILYTGNFERITCPRKFACYCGVAPFKNESGTSVRKGTRVSFYANRKLKSFLNFGAMNAVKADPQLRAYYQKKTAEKNSKMLVLNAVRNKLVHRMFAVVKRGTPYVVGPVF
ncbi:MAG: IS110 family transposase [Saprospiraceae bacterium]